MNYTISLQYQNKDLEINPNQICYYAVERNPEGLPCRVSIYLTGLQEPIVFEGLTAEVQTVLRQLS